MRTNGAAWLGLRFMALWASLFLALCAVSTPPLAAHELRPAIAEAVIGPGEALALDLSLNAEALLAGIGPEHEDTDDAPEAARYDALRALEPAALEEELRAFVPRLIDGIGLTAGGGEVALALDSVRVPPVGDTDRARLTELRLTGALPIGEALGWRFDPAFGDSVLRLRMAGADEPFDSVYVAAGNAAELALGEGAVRRGAMRTLVDYIPVGFDHIIPKGLDHILFVIGLFFLNTRLGPLLWQVTAFTLAHSVTLALAALEVVTVPGSVVEPLIALSIVFVAVENLLTDRLHNWRLAAVFAFGLLHGLGFASVLGEFGLPPGQFVAGLIGFNIGVEVGQLAVIAVCYLAVGLWFSGRPWYRRVIVYPVSLAIALVAAYWFFERIGMIG